MRSFSPIRFQWPATLIIVLSTASAALAQSLDDQLDRGRFIDGLAEYGLDDLLDYVAETTGADDPAAPWLVAIARHRAAILKPGVSADDRAAHIESLLGARRDLIEQLPDDDRSPVWQGDLAFDLLFLAPSVDAADVIVEFGIASDAQRQLIRQRADEALELTLDATALLSDVILDMEEDPSFTTSAALQQRHRTLATVELRQRLPFLQAVALGLSAICVPERGADLEHDWSAVISLLNPIVFDLAQPWQSRARAWLGVALLHSGRLDEAASQFAQALSHDAIDPIAKVRMTMARLELKRRGQGANAAVAALNDPALLAQTRSDPFMSILLADYTFLVQTTARLAPESRELLVPAAIRAADRSSADAVIDLAQSTYRRFLESPDLPLNRAAREEIVARRWELVVPASIPLDELPPVMALAAAQSMTSDPARRLEAIDLLTRLIEAPDAEAAAIARVRFALAGLLRQEGQDKRAAGMLFDLAHDTPRDAHAQQAATAAAAIYSDLYAKSSDDADLTGRYGQALDLLVTRFPDAPEIDRWAYLQGRFLEDQIEFDDAIAAYSSIASGYRWHPDALFRTARIRWVQAQSSSTTGALDLVITAAQRARSVANTAIATDEQRRADLRYYVVACDILTARAHLAQNQFDQTIAVLDGFEDRPDIPESLMAEAIDLRIKAMEHAGQTDQIAAQLAALSQRDPSRAVSIFNRITSTRLSPLSRAGQLESLDADDRALIEREILPWARQAMTNAGALAPDSPARMQAALNLAAAQHLVGDDVRALSTYDSLNDLQRKTVDAVLGRAQCHYALGEYARALEGFRAIQTAFSSDRNEVYWLSELRTLQIFDQAGRNVDRIYPTIQRLRLTGTDFARNPFYREFAVLEGRYGP